jgi:hypothetical protein
VKPLLYCCLATILLVVSCHESGQSGIPSATIIRPGTTFRADPDPIIAATAPGAGVTTLAWHVPVDKAEIHIGSPGGKLFAAGGRDGHAETGPWVTNNMIFYLQDATSGKSNDPSSTLATLPVAVR